MHSSDTNNYDEALLSKYLYAIFASLYLSSTLYSFSLYSMSLFLQTIFIFSLPLTLSYAAVSIYLVLNKSKLPRQISKNNPLIAETSLPPYLHIMTLIAFLATFISPPVSLLAHAVQILLFFVISLFYTPSIIAVFDYIAPIIKEHARFISPLQHHRKTVEIVKLNSSNNELCFTEILSMQFLKDYSITNGLRCQLHTIAPNQTTNKKPIIKTPAILVHKKSQKKVHADISSLASLTGCLKEILSEYTLYLDPNISPELLKLKEQLSKHSQSITANSTDISDLYKRTLEIYKKNECKYIYENLDDLLQTKKDKKQYSDEEIKKIQELASKFSVLESELSQGQNIINIYNDHTKIQSTPMCQLSLEKIYIPIKITYTIFGKEKTTTCDLANFSAFLYLHTKCMEPILDIKDREIEILKNIRDNSPSSIKMVQSNLILQNFSSSNCKHDAIYSTINYFQNLDPFELVQELLEKKAHLSPYLIHNDCPYTIACKKGFYKTAEILAKWQRKTILEKFPNATTDFIFDNNGCEMVNSEFIPEFLEHSALHPEKSITCIQLDTQIISQIINPKKKQIQFKAKNQENKTHIAEKNYKSTHKCNFEYSKNEQEKAPENPSANNAPPSPNI